MKDTLLYRLLRPLLVLYFMVRYNPKIIGKENIPKKGSFILVANHSSNFDFISMGITTKRQVHFLAKDSLFKGVLKPIMNGAGAIPVNRKIKDKSVIPRGRKALQNGLVLGIFPEGTFNKGSFVLAPFKIGAVKLAFEEEVPIIPIAINGEYRFNKLKIVVGQSFIVESENLELENNKLMKTMENIIIRSRRDNNGNS